MRHAEQPSLLLHDTVPREAIRQATSACWLDEIKHLLMQRKQRKQQRSLSPRHCRPSCCGHRPCCRPSCRSSRPHHRPNCPTASDGPSRGCCSMQQRQLRQRLRSCLSKPRTCQRSCSHHCHLLLTDLLRQAAPLVRQPRRSLS